MIPRIATGFARHLASYDTAATAQAQIAARLAARIAPQIAPAARMLELGHGTGFLTRQLARLDPGEIWLNDLVAPLPEMAWPAGTKVRALPGDAAALRFPARLELIASASMLQWLPDPAALLHRAAQALCPGGILAIASFGPQNFPELAGLGLPPGAPSYRDAAGLCADLPAGMQILAAWDERIPLAFADARALMAHLRATGVNGLRAGHLSVPRLRGMMQQMNLRGQTTLTYRPSYCIARRCQTVLHR